MLLLFKKNNNYAFNYLFKNKCNKLKLIKFINNTLRYEGGVLGMW